MNFDIASARFGVYDSPTIGKGFKIISKFGFLSDIHESSLYSVFQLPQGVEQLSPEKYILKVDYVSSKKSGLDLFFLSYYKFTKIDSDNRMCYEAFNMTIKFNKYFLPDFSLIEDLFIQVLNDKLNNSNVSSLIPYKVYQSEISNNKLLVCQTRIIDIAKKQSLSNLLFLFFMNFSDRKSVLYTDDESLVQKIADRFQVANISMFKEYTDKYNPLTQIKIAIDRLKETFLEEIHIGEHNIVLLKKERENLIINNNQLYEKQELYNTEISKLLKQRHLLKSDLTKLINSLVSIGKDNANHIENIKTVLAEIDDEDNEPDRVL